MTENLGVRHLASKNVGSDINRDDAIEKYGRDLVNKLIHPKDEDDFKSAKMDIIFSWPYHTGLMNTLITALQENPDDETIKKIYPLYANRYGLEVLRRDLGEYALKNEDFGPILAHVDNVLGFDQTNKPSTLKSTYKEMEEEFMSYPPNKELLLYETSLIQKVFSLNNKILDIGCGPAARHMNELQKAGFNNLEGVDIVPSNVSRATKDNPTLKIRVADWHDLPFENNSLDGIYCLGRSILHNTTLDDFLDTLREMHRVLNKYFVGDSPKKVIIDMPDVEKGEYTNLANDFSDKLKSLSIYDYSFGNIHDSADQEHFLDRFVPRQQQFELMAHVCGFEAKIISKRAYGNKGDINIYWELTPNGRPMKYREYMSMFGRELTGNPLLTIDMSRNGY